MAKNPRVVMCRNCNNLIPEKVKTCPSCGAKNKKSFFKRVWFVILIILVVIVAAVFINQRNLSKGEKFEWNDMELGNVLPAPKSNIGEVFINSDDSLSVYVYKTTKEAYKDYVSECENKGFTLESSKGDTRYSAYNAEGYDLTLWYFNTSKELHINLEAPIELGALQWPSSELVSLLPVPKSNVGAIEQESSDRFFAYVGETSLEDYHAYVNECSANGFTVDYNKGDNFYIADDAGGYHISLQYYPFNVMSIEINRPQKSVSESASPTSKPTVTTEIHATLSTANPKPASSETIELINGMRPEFKAAMDSYEAFYDEYCDFMKQYDADNPSDLALLSEYLDMLSKAADMNEKFDAWNEADMNDAELKYYLEVSSRVAQKLLEVAQ